MNKRIAIFMAMASMAVFCAKAQERWKPFGQFDLGIEVGTTGYGLELSSPLADFARVRTGFHYVPRIEVPMHFGIQVGDDPSKSQSKFEKMRGLLEDFSGAQIDSQIDMIGRPVNFWNWNVLVDFFPLKGNKHWHISGGFYLGPSRIAKAYNTTEDMSSLMAVGMYNNMYDKLINDRIKANPDLLYEAKLIDLSALGPQYASSTDPAILEALQKKFQQTGRMGVHVGDYTHDVYYPEDVYVQLKGYDYENVDENGDPTPIMRDVLVHKKGDIMHAKGDPYMMEPDENGMMKADVRVNSFKPYLGFGYEGRLSKKDDRYKIAADFGVLFWGGTPQLKTHEGVDMLHDVENISGKVGRYADAIDKFKVFPVLSVRLTRRL